MRNAGPARLTLGALAEIAEIVGYIAADAPERARSFKARLLDRMRRAGRAPHAGRIVPELGMKDIREVFEGNYRIIYRVKPRGISVLAVREGHRSLDGIDPERDT